MKDANASVVCEHMGPHDAVVSYGGAICQIGAIALERQLNSLFGYYQYNCVELRLESPGGSVDALHYMLRQMTRYEERGKEVAVQSTFLCASAAAILLAMGKWGHRRVDRSTNLLFHSARVEATGYGMTAATSTNLSNALSDIDHRLVDVLIQRMVMQAGGEESLACLVLDRCQKVDQYWLDVASKLNGLYPEVESKRRPDWFRALSKLAINSAERGRFALELKKHLFKRMQYDVRMDLREAFCTCLIDEIIGVVDGSVRVTEEADHISDLA